MSRPPRARAAVLDAAERVLLQRSPAAFTLDAVAAEAGVSKGGLIYHYPSKEALLEALVSRAVEAVDAELAPAMSATEPGAFARAYLDVTVPVEPEPGPGDHGGGAGAPGATVAALTAAVALDPRLLRPLRAAYAHWQDRLERDGIDAAVATAVRLAVDGWWLAALVGLPPLRPQVHRATRTLLARMCAGDVGENHPPVADGQEAVGRSPLHDELR